MTLPQLTRRILTLHAARYPRWEIQDAVKLLYQSEFGPARTDGTADPVEGLAGELSQARAEAYAPPYTVEAIGEGLCRFHLDPRRLSEADMPLLDRCLRHAQRPEGDGLRLWEKLGILSGMARSQAGPRAGDQVEFFLTRWSEEGCPDLRHSEPYREAYHPHYRILPRDLAAWGPALRSIERALANTGGPVLVSIDGRRAAGKTSFARRIAELFPCNVFHLDDYRLPEGSGTDEPSAWSSLELDRVENELLLPLSRGEDLPGTPFRQLNLIEGSCALHPRLTLYSQVRILLTCTPEVQLARLAQQEDQAGLEQLCDQLLPREEEYLAGLELPALCDAIIDTSRLPRPLP